MIYDFENCTLDTSTQELWRDEEVVAAEPQVFAVLEHLFAVSAWPGLRPDRPGSSHHLTVTVPQCGRPGRCRR